MNSCFFLSNSVLIIFFYKVVQLIGTFQNNDYLVPFCTVQIPAFKWSLNLALVCEKSFLKSLITAFQFYMGGCVLYMHAGGHVVDYNKQYNGRPQIHHC